MAMDKEITFMIIGAQKTGTTSLFYWLKQHPDIFLPNAKEINFFTRDQNFDKGNDYLDSFYQAYRGEDAIGLAYVHSMYFKCTSQRIYDYNPKMKVIVVLREPVSRAYSAYLFAKRNGWEKCNCFEEAIGKESERIKGSYQDQAELTYLSHGHYAEQLAPYFRLFGKDNICVLLNENLRDNPHEQIKKVMDFLGVKKAPIDTSKNINMASKAKVKWIQKVALEDDNFIKRVLRKTVPDFLLPFIRSLIFKITLEWNVKQVSYPPLQESTLRRLQNYYREQNHELEKLIGEDLSSWYRV